MPPVPRHLWWDLALSALLVLFSLPGIDSEAAQLGAHPLAYALSVTAALSLTTWRLWPMVAFIVAGAAWVAYLGLGYTTGTVTVTVALAVYGLCARSRPRRALAATAVLLAAGAVATGVAVATGARDWPDLVTATAWLALPAALGVVIRTRRDAAAAVRAAQVRRAVSEERLRLAREVHDVAGHGLAVIAMQAGVGLRRLDRDPDSARSVLEAIRAASTEALGQLRAEVGVLRQTDESSDGPLRPQTGLRDLGPLVERMRGGGLPVFVEATVDIDELPDELDHAAYRIVQESLTNVLRHASSDVTATVHIARRGDVLEIEVTDDGRGRPDQSTPAGSGIDGMRRRARALGGTLTAGPVRPCGFRVQAQLPLPASGGVA